MDENNTDFEEKRRKNTSWAERIKIAREHSKITQRDLVKRIGVNQTNIVYYESGRREPKIGYLMALVRETDVNGEWLLTGKGDIYGEEKKKITKEEAIEALFGDKADELVSYLLDAMKDPFLRAVLYTKCIEHKVRQKND